MSEATLFVCATCEAVLTAPLVEVALPVHVNQSYYHELYPPLMEPGTYAVVDEPSGPPWRRWDDVGADAAEKRGYYAPVYSLSFGPAGVVVIAPGDVRGTVLVPGRVGGYCIGLDGRDGPNLACQQCGRPVATRIDDCSYWQSVRLDPRAVHPCPGGPGQRVLGWDELPATPPVEPNGAWSSVWAAAVGDALARVVAVSGGARIGLPEASVAAVFGRALDVLLPPGDIAADLFLVGPGVAERGDGIALVPRHPQTGEIWPCGARAVVPLASDVWVHLAFDRPRRLPVPQDVRRDDPAPLLPDRPFSADRKIFLATLARLPAVREPWLREIYDRVGNFPLPPL
ncbi:hypothetical protein BTM25_20890 [Actinomadura rubteroloni]|uniref:Uncharacterized protein n=1 Tax=Actinomadura rubteroloni TaxID=1926885 RepID=A0A2P4URJ0_9ACTN|nr:hypothetical protein BTM25_20890 [Actinomadura rubteroloni]